jgi:hypothetical protein
VVAHGFQNCHTLDGEMLCCSSSGNNVYPRAHNLPPDMRVDTMGFGECSERGGGSRFHATGLVFINTNSAGKDRNPYMRFHDMTDEEIEKELQIVPNPSKRPYGVEDCDWNG